MWHPKPLRHPFFPCRCCCCVCLCVLLPQILKELEGLHLSAAEQLEGLYEARLALEKERLRQMAAAKDDLELALKVALRPDSPPAVMRHQPRVWVIDGKIPVQPVMLTSRHAVVGGTAGGDEAVEGLGSQGASRGP